MVFGEEARGEFVGFADVFGIAGECGPTEWTFALAEHGADIFGHEAFDVESVFHSGFNGIGADVVAIVEGDSALRL